MQDFLGEWRDTMGNTVIVEWRPGLSRPCDTSQGQERYAWTTGRRPVQERTCGNARGHPLRLYLLAQGAAWHLKASRRAPGL